jgi:ribosomal protein L18E
MKSIAMTALLLTPIWQTVVIILLIMAIVILTIAIIFVVIMRIRKKQNGDDASQQQPQYIIYQGYMPPNGQGGNGTYPPINGGNNYYPPMPQGFDPNAAMAAGAVAGGAAAGAAAVTAEGNGKKSKKGAVIDDDEAFFAELNEDYEGDIPISALGKIPLNFRVRMKLSHEENYAMYEKLTNKFNSYSGISFRMSGRIERVNYNGNPIAYIGVTRRWLKLRLALNPKDYSRKKYLYEDFTDDPIYSCVPMLVRIKDEDGLNRAFELIEDLVTKFGLTPKRRCEERDMQQLAFTLKYNALLKDKRHELLSSSVEVKDTDVLSNKDMKKYEEVYHSRSADESDDIVNVSLDVLEENFRDGQKVTLEKLKKKGLVDEDCNGYCVTVGNKLTKPMIVYADDFSPKAAKMILLTGGRAIKLVNTPPYPEDIQETQQLSEQIDTPLNSTQEQPIQQA